MDSLLVRVWTGAVWQTISAAQATITRRVGVADAVFFIPDALVADRIYLRQHREVRITLTHDSTPIYFAGYVEKAKVKADGPNHFGLEVTCVGLEMGATTKPIFRETYPDKLHMLATLTIQPDAAAGKDAYIDRGLPDLNLGGNPQLAVERDNISACRSLLQFDLSGIPANSRVESAKLYLFMDPIFTPHDIAVDIAAHAILDPWDEGTVTWNTRPSYDPTADDVTRIVGHGSYAWDLSGLVQCWLDGDVANNGVILVAVNETSSPFEGKAFCSSDYGGAPPLPTPALEVQYVPSIAYTDVLLDLWATYWPAIDRSRVVADVRVFGQEEVYQYKNLAQATEMLMGKLPNYHWWIEWEGGAAYYLRAEPRGSTPTGKTLTAMDVSQKFEMEPANTDVRDVVYVIGGVGGGDTPAAGIDPLESEADEAIRGFAEDPASQVIHGVRPDFVVDGTITTREQANDRAAAEMAEKNWEYFQVDLAVADFALKPGDGLTLDIPGIGLDGIIFTDQYVVARTVDTYSRGRVSRTVTLREEPR